MLETSSRLLRLLSLLEMRREWAGPELASRLGVDTRTIRRDMDKLRELGYPVHSTPGAAGGYRLGAGAQLPPLLLDDDEAVAVAVGLRTAANGTVAGIEEASVGALAKLEQVLPSRLRQRVNALQSVTVSLTGAGPTVDPQLLTSLAAACRDSDRLRFQYADRDAETTVRTTEPHRLVCTGRRWYLLAWDVDRVDWRTFRVDRVAQVLAKGPRFEPRQPPEDAATYVSRAISSDPYRYRARVLLHAPAEAVSQRIWPSAGVVTAVSAESCLLETGAESLDALAVMVAVTGADFEVQEPAELREHLQGLADRLRRAAGST
ncbi:MAG: YafY family transcriptional regulator [Chloroflexi bacterium]|nr:YafY family transcriptional regulator [Chloroflexota bacterium]